MSHSHAHSSASGTGAHHASTGHDHGHGALHVHLMPMSTLFTIFGALIVLTIATVVVSQFHLGAWEVPIAMTIATVKALMVAVYFMHLRYDNPFNAMVFCFSLLFVGLFLGITLMDVRAYQGDLIPPDAPVREEAPATGTLWLHQRAATSLS